MDTPLDLAIVGCGLIGRKRAQALAGARLVMACDLDPARAQSLAALSAGCQPASDLDSVLRSSAQVVVVATANHALAPVALAAVRAGKHVLIEKPGAISAAELETLATEAAERQVRVRIGYNHRYHPALRKARELIDAGAVGELMFLRGRYGHGGRLGYEKEWRGAPPHLPPAAPRAPRVS